jgi:hypothetical protein
MAFVDNDNAIREQEPRMMVQDTAAGCLHSSILVNMAAYERGNIAESRRRLPNPAIGCCPDPRCPIAASTEHPFAAEKACTTHQLQRWTS